MITKSLFKQKGKSKIWNLNNHFFHRSKLKTVTNTHSQGEGKKKSKLLFIKVPPFDWKHYVKHK